MYELRLCIFVLYLTQHLSAMHKETIGINAGIVWTYLNENGATTLSDLKKKTKIKEPFLSMSLGWLARENKIRFVIEEESVLIELI